MKKLLIYTAVFFTAVLLIFGVMFPHLETIQEYDDFFVWDKAFFIQKLSDVPGLTSWLKCWMLQFFRWAFVGALIEAALLSAIALLTGLVLKRLGSKNLLLALLPALGTLTFCLHEVDFYLQAAFFFAALLAFLYIGNRWCRWAFVFVFMVVGYLLLTWLELLTLLVVMTVIEVNFFKTDKLGFVLLAGAGLVMADVALYSENVAFVPYAKRYFYILNDLPMWQFFGILLLPLVLAVLPKEWFKVFDKMKYALPVAMGLLMAVCLYFLATDKLVKYSEKSYELSDMADNGDWQTLLETVPREDMQYNKYFLMYALMAESALGQLPEHLMNYPITSSMQFKCHKETNNKYSCIINRQFYAQLGLYDEAVRQAFEYGVNCNEGYSLGAMRNMVEYAAKEGNKPLAEKYLCVLENTSCHGSFVKEWRDKLAKSKKQPTKMLRANNFAGAFLFNSEMVRYLQLERKNKKYLDYLLCGLLLDRKLPQFRAILDECNLYEGQPLPKLYAEAMAMLNVGLKNLHESYNYDDEYDMNQAAFREALSTNDIVRVNGMSGTYWYYCYSTTNSDVQTGATRVR